MTREERQQLVTLARYIESGVSLLESGRTLAGKESIEMAKVLAEVMLSMAFEKKR